MKGSVTWTTSLTTLQPDVGVQTITRAACVMCGRESSRPSEILTVASRLSLFDGLFLFFSLHFYIFKLPVVKIQKAAEVKQKAPLSIKTHENSEYRLCLILRYG